MNRVIIRSIPNKSHTYFDNSHNKYKLWQLIYFGHWNVIYFTALHMWSEIDINIFAKSNISIKYTTNMINFYTELRQRRIHLVLDISRDSSTFTQRQYKLRIRHLYALHSMNQHECLEVRNLLAIFCDYRSGLFLFMGHSYVFIRASGYPYGL